MARERCQKSQGEWNQGHKHLWIRPFLASLWVCQRTVPKCTYRHPARVGRCLRCGSTGHQLSTCKRPRRDAKAKPMAKPQPKEKARAKSKARAKPNQRRGANAAWAQGEEMDSTVIIEEVDEEADETLHVAAEYTACSFFTSYPPVYHSASTVTSAHSTEPTETSPILDSGATHCLLLILAL